MSHWDLCPQGLTIEKGQAALSQGPVQEQKQQEQPDRGEENRRGPPSWVYKEKGNLLDG